MKYDPIVTANASALTVTIVYIVCRLAFSVAPQLSFAISRAWMHGVAFERVATPFAGGTFILGLVTATIGGWILGYIFASFYNYFSKKVRH